MEWKCRMTTFVQLSNFLFILWIMFSHGRTALRWLQWVETTCQGSLGNINNEYISWIDVKLIVPFGVMLGVWMETSLLLGHSDTERQTHSHWLCTALDKSFNNALRYYIFWGRHWLEAMNGMKAIDVSQMKPGFALVFFMGWGGLVAEWWMRKRLWFGIMVVVLAGTNLKGRAW